ncbi:MAG: hypothetical protein IPI95_07285 [Flavobacteriales bacterium]|nr:hypothetical protein [Flavobacteriales bacterium]
MIGDVPGRMLDPTLGLVILFVLIDPVYDAWTKGEKPLPKGLLGISLYAALVAGILIFGYFGSASFIYFQF